MIAILDIGKTNKKCLVFDEDYHIVFEKTTRLPETTDEEGDACEDLGLLNNWVLESIREILEDTHFQIRAFNCTTYGASFVHLDSGGQPLTPLYNYLKPFPVDLRKQFFDTYGDESKIALETASPMLGNLNSGLQLYWLKYRKPEIFTQIKWSLHLPQYIATLLHSAASPSTLHLPPSAFHPPPSTSFTSEITSIGCHTMLWDFQKNDYHDWVKAEGIAEKFPRIVKSGGDFKSRPDYTPITNHQSTNRYIGTGLHDSSAALIPYLAYFDEPFVLISTGTWCISLNPFNYEPLTPEELAQDCLCYLTYEGKPVKAARYFGGHEHELAVKQIAAEFGVAEDFYKAGKVPAALAAETAYFDFMRQLVEKQVASTRLAVGNPPVKRIFVDGGFSKNKIYMNLLAGAFPDKEVFAAEVAQATSLGAAMVLHTRWNKKPIPKNLIAVESRK